MAQAFKSSWRQSLKPRRSEKALHSLHTMLLKLIIPQKAARPRISPRRESKLAQWNNGYDQINYTAEVPRMGVTFYSEMLRCLLHCSDIPDCSSR